MILFICSPFFALRQIIADSVPASRRHCVSSGNTGLHSHGGGGCGVGSQEGLRVCAFFFFVVFSVGWRNETLALGNKLL